ncbi:MAG: glycosyltransferase family 4 protein [Actinomycetes bacterium]
MISDMRVLVVMPGVGADGGAEHSLRALLPRLLADGHQVHLAVLTGVQALVGEFERAGVVTHDLSSASSVRRRVVELREVVRAIRPDLVHATLFDAAVPAQIVGRATGVPVLVTWAVTLYDDDHFAESAANAAKLRVTQQVEATLARLCRTRFHAVTEGVARVNGRTLRVPSGRVRVGERGRPSPEWTRAAPPDRPDGVPPTGRYLLAVGRQEPQKGYPELLVAFDQVAEAFGDVHLVVAGREGNDSRRIDSTVASLRFAERVHLLGQRDDVAALIAGAEAVVCASKREGAAGALIESMSAGVPVVSVRLPGLEGVITDGFDGLVVDRSDLAEGLRRLLGDADLGERLGTGGLATFVQRFTVAAAVDQMEQIYRWAAEPG